MWPVQANHIALSAVLLALFAAAYVALVGFPCDANSSEAEWASCIERYGVERAHARFVKENEKQLPGRHERAHVFGGALYETVGARAGIAVCTSRFAGGCFHEVVGRALVREGEGIILRITDICKAGGGGYEPI